MKRPGRGMVMIALRSMRHHLLSTLITILSVALASGLVMAVFSIKNQTYEAFTGGPVGFDAVVGARGSQLQLVLDTVFHLETSPGNIPWRIYADLQKNPAVALAVPYAVGDNYKGYRIVGTTTDMFTKFEYRAGTKFQVGPGERIFDPDKKEAVIGSYVAEKTGLHAGSTFNPYHGLVYAENAKHKDEYTVVGVMKPTNSPSDRVVWIPIDGVFRMAGHVLRGNGNVFKPVAGQEIPDENKEVSAVMLKFNGMMGGFFLDQSINMQGNVATMAWPIARVMAELFDKIGWVNRILELVAYLVIVVSAGSILASIYNTISERRREFAILRSLGARKTTVFSAIVFEAMAIAAVGTVFGYLVDAGILYGAAIVIRAQTGVVLNPFQYDRVLYIAPLAMIGVGMIAGILPALKAYSTDVASNLSPVS